MTARDKLVERNCKLAELRYLAAGVRPGGSMAPKRSRRASRPTNAAAREATKRPGADVKLLREEADVGIRLLDDARTAWVEAEIECGRTLEAWSVASPRYRAEAYLAYRAALDREAAAAADLQRLLT